MTEQRRYRITIPIIIACAIAPISHAVGAIGSTASPLIINAWNQPLYIPVNNNAAETADAPDTSLNIDNDNGCQGYQVRLNDPSAINNDSTDFNDINEGATIKPKQDLLVAINDDDDDTDPYCNFIVQDRPLKPHLTCFVTIRKNGTFDINSGFCNQATPNNNEAGTSPSAFPSPHISDYITAFSTTTSTTKQHQAS